MIKTFSKEKLIFLLLLFLTCTKSILSAQNITLNQNDVNIFDRTFMQPYSKNLDFTGTAFEVATLLTPAVMLAAPSQDYWKIGLQYAETIAIAYGVKELFKLFVNRPRPYMYFEGAPQNKIDNGDWNNSFISGHTTLSFAAATFTTYMMNQYFPNSRNKQLIIATSYSLATITAGLRLASGNHFLTDVLCGAAVGSAMGFLVPWLNSFWLKPSFQSENSKISANISPIAFSLRIKF